jgi:hypothetical protein
VDLVPVVALGDSLTTGYLREPLQGVKGGTISARRLISVIADTDFVKLFCRSRDFYIRARGDTRPPGEIWKLKSVLLNIDH